MATKTNHFMRPLVALVALVAAMAALLLAYGPNPAQAAGDCSTTSGTTTCTFGPTGSEDTFVVPALVDTIHVVATGARGAVRVQSRRSPAQHPTPRPPLRRGHRPARRARLRASHELVAPSARPRLKLGNRTATLDLRD